MTNVTNSGQQNSGISYTYDALYRRSSMTAAGQPAVNYDYDASSRLTGIESIIKGAFANFTMQYDALGRKTALTYPNGVTTTYNYDNASNVLNLQHLNPLNQVLESLNYTYDPNGNRITMDRLNTPVKLPNPASNATYNAANQMLTFNDKSMTYDENGNTTSATNSCGRTVYTWDARSRLVSMQGFAPGCTTVTASFKYDALGRRIQKTINGRTIQYLYDGQDIVQEIEQGVAKVNYLRTLSIDEPLARVESNGVVRYFQKDALGSVVALVDEGGAMRTRYMYDPFGNVTVTGETSDNLFQYSGRENDGSGLYYYRARYYSPQLQRFISPDLIGYWGGLNLYGYVANGPINFIDPLGLEKVLSGNASWYPPTGNPTASGEEYDPTAMTAAMQPFNVPKFGTKVKVKYKDECGNPHEIEVTVNDRGPWQKNSKGKWVPHADRIIDLTPTAFEALGVHKSVGVIPVSVVIP